MWLLWMQHCFYGFYYVKEEDLKVIIFSTGFNFTAQPSFFIN